MQALQRLVQKNINMEVLLQPTSLAVQGADVNGGAECKVVLRIIRGPLTWKSSRSYSIFPEDTSLTLTGEEFRKQSGFYFTKDGAEYKKATIKVCKVIDEETELEEELSSNDFNLSSLIASEVKDTRIEIAKAGILSLNIMAKVFPVDDKDKEFVSGYLTNSQVVPSLQTPSTKNSRFRDIFSTKNSESGDPLQIAKEVKELEEREKYQD